MGELELLFDLHRDKPRQGPGSRAATRRAIELAGLATDGTEGRPLEIVDMGCGTGAAARVLARALDARITAVDFGEVFLEELVRRAEAEGVGDRIEPLCASFEELPLEEGRFDAVWSEGAIYTIGFAQGVADWRRFLKPGGVLVASEITWTTATRPDAVEAFWRGAYPEIDVASAKFEVLEQAGYSPIGYFTLPPECWLDGYYEPLDRGHAAFLERHGGSEAAERIVADERREFELYRRYGAYYSYGVYIARRVD